MTNRIAVVANIHSLFLASREAYQNPISYPTLVRSIVGSRNLFVSSACCIGPRNGQEKFLTILRNYFEIIMAPNEGRLRDEFAREMIRVYSEVDKLVLVTNDESLCTITDYIADSGSNVKLELWCIEKLASETLKDSVDFVYNIDESYIFQQAKY